MALRIAHKACDLPYLDSMPTELTLRNFKAALFDVDGTLVDSLQMLTNGLGDTYARYADRQPTDEEIRGLIGIPLDKQLGMFSAVPPTEAEMSEMVAYTIERYQAHEHLESVFPEALEMLRICRALGIKTALVTSKNSLELSQFLARFSGAEYVDTAVCASDVGLPKPDPESAYLACARLEVEPHEAVMIGDSIFDIRCARQAGVASVGVSYGSAPYDSMRAEQPDALFESPAALLDWARDLALELPCHERN